MCCHQNLLHIPDSNGHQASTTPQICKNLQNVPSSIFGRINGLAVQHGAVNLGQGFPNFDGPDSVKEAAMKALQDAAGKNQYAPIDGLLELRKEIATTFKRDTGLIIDPITEVTVTTGCSEAISSSIMGLLNPGDEAIVFAPFFEVYQAILALKGATMKTVVLRPPNFEFSESDLRSAISSKTRAILLNTPHNPTGKVFNRRELELIAKICIEHNLLVFSDEVYNKLVYEGEHISIATLPGMFCRTITMNSIGKTFSLTGWKIGWAIAPANITRAIRVAHWTLTFCTNTPMQWGAVQALQAPDSYYADLVEQFRIRKDVLVSGLRKAGFTVYQPQGGYFVMADHTSIEPTDGLEFCEELIKKTGVAAIPLHGFYSDPVDGANVIRFAFCKDFNTLNKAVDRLNKGFN